MLLFVLVPALVGLSLLGQRPAAALLKVKGPVRPLIPFAPGTPALAQFAVRAAGLGFTFLLVVAVEGPCLRCSCREEILHDG